ncbi:hypothetical protein MXD62_16765 [Frankia sp. Mgl5]|uniref:hypothetical protein n=1 Tax=Frankia sp. Mgl5 TaxID=2933793 RepID=UPI00200C3D2E|nr:hypothetical protein [Frankia sp. Mgl5]MCK9928809.1 hypothetical protein [Frankia sp. Mgl5]
MPTPMDLDKLRSIGFVRAGQIGPQVREGRDEAGRRFKEVTDEQGHTTTQRGDGGTDLTLRPATIRAGTVVHAGQAPQRPRVDPAAGGYAPCRCGDHSRGDHPARDHL